MRIVGISDTHGQHSQVVLPDGDVLVHCGDSTNGGQIFEMQDFMDWFCDQPHRHKVMIPGNHDWALEAREKHCREYLKDKKVENTHLLIDESVEIMGRKFYGSPWTPSYGEWSFQLPRYEMNKKWIKIPEDTDILITHGPPYGHNDVVNPYDDVPRTTGCLHLTCRVYEVDPIVHLFGHIHGGYGRSRADLIQTTFVNCSITIDNFGLALNKPQIIDA